MVSLTMMARLLEAVRPQARLVLVGDPDQLTSVDAGAVLSDLVAGLRAAARSRRSPRSPRTSAPPRTSRRSPRRCASATPTRCSTRCGPPSDQVEFVETERRRAGPRSAPDWSRPPLCACARPPRPATRARRGRRPRRAPAAVRAPRGPVRRTPLEPAGRALARRGDRRSESTGRVVRRPPAAGHRQRLRARRLQRRHRRGRAAADGRLPARVIAGLRTGCSTSRPAGSTRSRPCTR